MDLIVKVDVGKTTVYSHKTIWRIFDEAEFEKTYHNLLTARMIITIAALTNNERYELDRYCMCTWIWDEENMTIELNYHVKKI